MGYLDDVNNNYGYPKTETPEKDFHVVAPKPTSEQTYKGGIVIEEVTVTAKKPVSSGNAEVDKIVTAKLNSIKTSGDFLKEYQNNSCLKTAIDRKYEEIKDDDGDSRKQNIKDKIISVADRIDVPIISAAAGNLACNTVYKKEHSWAMDALRTCLIRKWVEEKHAVNAPASRVVEEIDVRPDVGPFDRRMWRFIYDDKNFQEVIPMGTKYRESATSGLILGIEDFDNAKAGSGIDSTIQREELIYNRKKLRNDINNQGVPALVNTYALTKLFGSEGGEYLINKQNERKWYEVDQTIGPGADNLAFSTNPNTSSLISWGLADPYGRTPYHFTDFVFAKYWNKVENNRLITLRRYPAPIYDNLKFPGMDGGVNKGTPASPDKPGTDENTTGTIDQGESTKKSLPPMAHAITYFGEETGNNLSEILKFSTGLRWDDVKADVWEVNATSTPDSEAGPGGQLFKRLAGLSKMLSVGSGSFDQQLIANKGDLPPDPYGEGMPYENRIMGPVNRIDSVKRRVAGLDFEWAGLNLQFEYVARPVGGVNPKAVLLDILSNFLIIGSASAVFFGGQHRFMGNPAKYPFLGGEKGIEAWYNGDPIGWGKATVDNFAGQVVDGGLLDGAKDFFNKLLGRSGEGGIEGIFGAVKGLFSEGGIANNVIKHQMAAKSAGQVPYLTGLKALLTGEPVGEWHVTVGNPLNPIAMIGNLICTGIEIEFGDELGPDDFPTEIKITVKLDHGMPRDRDAIQSIFNRGMGRIYDLPDGYSGSADGVTAVDAYTQHEDEAGTPLAIRGWLAGPSKLGGKSGPPVIKQPSNAGSVSVWDRNPFRTVSPNQDTLVMNDSILRSGYRSLDWVALKSLK